MLTHISGKRSGQTMIEVAVATLIAAITTVAVFSVILSGFVSQRKADKKELVAMLLKDAQQTLQAFVSADVSNATACGGYCAPTPFGLWSAATPANQWALAAGQHDISSLMNPPASGNVYAALRGAPPAPCVAGSPVCYFTYLVTDDNSPTCVGGTLGAGTNNACKTVTFDMRYAD